MEQIVRIKTSLKVILVKLDIILCSPNPRNSQNMGIIKLEKEQYRCLLIFLFLAWILELIVYKLQLIPFSFLLLFSISNTMFIFLLYQQKFLILKITLVLFLATIGFISLLIFKSTEYAISFHIIYPILPILALLFTRSFFGSLFVYLINLLQSFYSYGEIKNCGCYQENFHLPSMMISLSAGLGFIFLAIFGVIFKSRNEMILELYVQQDKVEEINTKLLRLNNELVETLEAKKNLFLSVSHEVKNPLNIISGSAHLLLQNNLDKKGISHVETIMITCNLLNHLINNLLYGAKMEINEFKIIKTSVDMKSFTANLWNTNKILVQKKKLYGEMFISKIMPHQLEMDSMRALQIAYNIVSNSVKFTKEGYVAFICTWIEESEYNQNLFNNDDEDSFRQFLYSKRFIEHSKENFPETNSSDGQKIRDCGEKDQEGQAFLTKELLPYLSVKGVKAFSYHNLFDKYHNINFGMDGFPDIETVEMSKTHTNIEKRLNTGVGFLKMQVIDSGCGISKEDKDKLFKKFAQVGSDHNKQLGSGLGLWITKNICIQMGGDLQLNSRVDQGSVFTAIIKCP